MKHVRTLHLASSCLPLVLLPSPKYEETFVLVLQCAVLVIAVESICYVLKGRSRRTAYGMKTGIYRNSRNTLSSFLVSNRTVPVYLV